MQLDQIGPYKLIRRLGAGGMGSVYLGLDTDGEAVAVKVIHPHLAEDGDGLRRFAREAAAIKRISSPYVAEFLDTHLLPPDPYIVLRYVQGRSLQEIIETQGPLPLQTLRTVSIGLAAALDTIHAAGVVHRDLTPRNIMIADDVPVVIDFGISQDFDATRITQNFIGTPGYAPPEILQGHRAGPAADVFAWAVTVVFAATGRKCFGADTVLGTLHKTLHHDPALSGVPQDLLPVVWRALRKDPGDRPTSQSLIGVISAFSPTATPPLPQRDVIRPSPLSELWIAAGQAREEGNLRRAEELYEKVRHLAARTGDLGSQMFALYQLGVAAEASSHYDRAEDHYRRTRKLAAATAAPNIEILTLRGLERMATMRNQATAARQYADLARQVLEEKQGQGLSTRLVESADKYLRRIRRASDQQ